MHTSNGTCLFLTYSAVFPNFLLDVSISSIILTPWPIRLAPLSSASLIELTPSPSPA